VSIAIALNTAEELNDDGNVQYTKYTVYDIASRGRRRMLMGKWSDYAF
jgi:hypothetical protein